jgi:hypothetical protein
MDSIEEGRQCLPYGCCSTCPVDTAPALSSRFGMRHKRREKRESAGEGHGGQ